jgi:hypothetical protein
VFKFARAKIWSFLSSKTMQTFLGNLSITFGFLKIYALKSADSAKFFLILVFWDILFANFFTPQKLLMFKIFARNYLFARLPLDIFSSPTGNASTNACIVL